MDALSPAQEAAMEQVALECADLTDDHVAMLPVEVRRADVADFTAKLAQATTLPSRRYYTDRLAWAQRELAKELAALPEHLRRIAA